jgi:hypothetical protein
VKAENETRPACDESDVKLLVSLLGEYSGKLSKMCDIIEDSRTAESITFAGMALCSTAFLIFWSLLSNYRPSASNSSSPIFVLIGGMFAMVVIVILLLFKLFTNAKRRRKWVRDVSLFSKKLERVVRIISQIQDHSQGNVSSRLEMDFRLTEAEQSLDRALALGIGKTSKGLYE